MTSNRREHGLPAEHVALRCAFDQTVPDRGVRRQLFAFFEVFNMSNSWSPTSMTTQAFTEAKGVWTLTPTVYGQGSADAMAPDGTEARRMQVGLCFVF